MINIQSQKSKNIVVYTLLLFFIVAAFRFYNIARGTLFWSDTASDLYIAKSIVGHGTRPLVGPLLGVENFHSAPTYYYLLAILYFFLRTPDAIVYFFILFNLIGIYFLWRSAKLVADDLTALILILITGISSTLEDQSRIIWQPHPLFPLMAVSLFLLFKSRIKLKINYLVGSLLFYGIALSVYPSPILLFPYYLKISYDFFKNNNNKATSLLKSFLLVFVTAFPFQLPLVVYEMNNRLPTLSSAFWLSLPSLKSLYDGLLTYIYQLYLLFFPWDEIGAGPDKSLILIFLIGTGIITIILPKIVQQDRSNHSKFKLIYQPLWLLSGLFFLIVTNLDTLVHRLFAFLPLIYLFMAVVARNLLSNKSIIIRYLTVAAVSYYLIINAVLIIRNYTSIPSNQINIVQSEAVKIIGIIPREDLNPESLTVLAIAPNYVLPNYSIFPVLYYLDEYQHYYLPVIATGNDIDRINLSVAKTKYIVLLCRKAASYQEVNSFCILPFEKTHGDYRQFWKMVFTHDLIAIGYIIR